MPGIYDNDKVLKLQDVGDTIFNAESEKTPMTRLLKRGPKPIQMLSEWPVEKYPTRKFKGQKDGTDISTFNHTNRAMIQAYAMWLLTEGWMVSKLAGLTKTAGVPNEMAKQAADDGIIMAQMLERQLLSNDEAAVEGEGADAVYTSRGFFRWLQATAQAVLPVPAAHRPNAACRYAGALGSFLPANMEAMLRAAATDRKGPVDLTGYVGIALKAQMSTWPQRQFGDDNAAAAIQVMNLNAADKKLISVIDMFEYDSGTVNVVPSWYLACDPATGENTAYSTRSGVFVDMSMWRLCFLENPTAAMEPAKSGGPRGYHSSVYMLKCLNPVGQCSVWSGTDA